MTKRVKEWKNVVAQAYYTLQRQDPEFVEKKKVYLRALYKKKRKQRLAYSYKRLRGPLGEVLRARRRAWKKKYKAKRRAQGLSNKGNPLLSPEESYMLQVWVGLETKHNTPKRVRVARAAHARRMQLKRRRDRIEGAAKKFGIEITHLKKKVGKRNDY